MIAGYGFKVPLESINPRFNLSMMAKPLPCFLRCYVLLSSLDKNKSTAERPKKGGAHCVDAEQNWIAPSPPLNDSIRCHDDSLNRKGDDPEKASSLGSMAPTCQVEL